MMKKKILETLPDILATQGYINKAKKDIPVTENSYGFKYETYQWNIYIKAKVYTTEDGEVLKVALFDRKDLTANNKKSKYDIYIVKSKDEFTTWDSVKEKWRESMIDKLEFSNYTYSEDKKYSDKATEKTITEYLQGSKKTSFAAVHEYQCSVRADRLAQRHKSITSKIDMKMELIPKEPQDLAKFINDKALIHSRYIIYDYSRNVKEGYCTHCKKVVSISNPKHLKKGKCNSCKSKITFIARKKSKTIHDTGDASLLQITKEGYVLRFYVCTKTFKQGNLNNPELKYHEYKRIFYNNYFYDEDTYYWEEFKNTGTVRWVDNDNSSRYGYDGLSSGSRLYTRNLTRIIKDSELKYSAIELMAKNTSFNIQSFIKSYKTMKYIEKLIKVGLYNLTKEITRYSSYSCMDEINPHEDRIKDILGLTKENLNIIKAIDGGKSALTILQKAQEYNIKLSIEQVRWIEDNYYHGEIIKYTRYSTIHKLIKYASALSRNEKRDWEDYIDWCQELGYDLKNEFILYPKPLAQAHDRVLEERNKIRDKKKLEKLKEESKLIKKMAADLIKSYGFETDKYIITVPKSAKEIIKEGQALHHCVGSYVERMATGSTVILFVRSKENIKKPFYTVEVREEKIIQCRGKNNCDMQDEIKEFIELFKKKRLQKEKVAS